MTTLDLRPAGVTAPRGAEQIVVTEPARTLEFGPALDIVVPVYNEQESLARSIHRLHRYLSASFPLAWRITIADNASTDATLQIAHDLARMLPDVQVVHLDEKGRGRALHQVWSASDADVLAYMDVDLSTDLAALLPLVAPLLSGHSDLAIGTRLNRAARVKRGPKREVISRVYNTILRTALGARFSDAQCGFKAIRRDRALELLPLVEDTGWFFDTELLVIAQRARLRIHEVPVDWTDDPDSRVDIVSTALADLHGVARMMRHRQIGRDDAELGRQAGTFAVIGVISTLAYLALFWALRPTLGAFGANTLALLLTAIANTAANRRLTFAVTGREGAMKHQAQGLVVFAVAWLLTTLSLGLLHLLDPHPARVVEVAALVVANLAATALRFVSMRSWVFALGR
jgi:putative flippase GtrA